MTVYEDFEDGDISEYGGDTGFFSVQQATVLEGAWSLEGSSDGSNYKSIVSTSGLSAYPSAGDTFRVRVRGDALGSQSGSATYLRFGWGIQSVSDIPDGYKISIDSTGDFILRKRVGGSGTNLDTAAVSVSSNTTYEIEIDWGDSGDLSATLYEDSNSDGSYDSSLGTVSATGETDFTSGGILWFVNASGALGRDHTAWFDYARDPAPNAPSNLSATAASNASIDLAWTDNSSDEDGFRIYRASESGGSFSQIDSVGANTTTYTDSGLTSNEDYYYKVTAYNQDGESDYSNEDGATTYATFTRSTSVHTAGDTVTTRTTSKPRNAVTEMRNGDVQSSRTINLHREAFTAPQDSEVAATRTTSLYRTTTNYADPTIDSTQALRPVFPSQEALDVQWDFDSDMMAFVTEWLDEDSHIQTEDRDGIGVVFNGGLETVIEVFVQYDQTGDGTIDVQSETQKLAWTYQGLTFDDNRLFGADGHYRVCVRGLRDDDTINQVDIGPVHHNL